MLNVVEKCFGVLMLIYFSSGITGFFADDSPLNVWRLEDNPLLLAIQTVMYVITLGLVILHWQKFINALRAAGWVLALAMLALLSTLWSSDPSFTLRRSLVVIATTLFGIYFGARYELPIQVRLVGWAFLILAVLSVICSMWLPQYGIDRQFHQGDWQGIFGQKNLLGKAMAVAIILLWSAKRVLPWIVRAAVLPLCTVLMLMSGSKAALVVSIVLLLTFPCYRILHSHMTTLVPLGIMTLLIIVGLISIAFENTSLLLAVLGRNATLTRRTEIWSVVWAAISGHILMGYGFSGFWAGLHGESARMAARLGFVARHAHNGFLDLWLELGITGLVLFAAGYLRAMGNGVRLLRMSGERLATWPLQYLAFMLLYNVAEGPILRQNSLYWALYVSVAVATATAVRIRKTLRAASPVHTIVPLAFEQRHNHLSRRPAGRLRNFHPEPGRGAA